MTTSRRTLFALLALGLILALAAPFTTGPAAADIAARQTELVTFYAGIATGHTPADLDPQVNMYASDPWSDALFLGLLDYDPLTGTPVPELALRWEVSDDGTVWTFTLRDDVPWVRWDPAAGAATVLRMVTAHDVVYGIQRACDPRTESYQDYLITDLIVGCGDLAGQDPLDVSDDDYDLVQVRAPDDTTLEIRLSHVAGYFLSMIPMPVLFPVPREVIAEHGAEWTEPGVILTNGPFVLDQFREDAWVLLRNPYFPAELLGPGNVERVVLRAYEYAAYLTPYITDQLDMGDGSEDPLRVYNNPVLLTQRHVVFEGVTYFLGITEDLPPMDNVHVRRALSAALDRDQFVDVLSSMLDYRITYYPMIHLTAPGNLGAPPINAPGVGYDPDYARAELALAGYPGCAGLPEITLILPEWGLDFGPAVRFLNHQFDEVLGCHGVVRSEDVSDEEWATRMGRDAPPDLLAHLWFSGWMPDYPDASGSLDIVHCAGWNDFRRSCTQVDDLIDQAAAESDVAVRSALVYDIEDRLFGPEGEVPLIPLHIGEAGQLFKPWVSGPVDTDWSHGGLHFDWYTIDQEAQANQRGGS